MNFDDVASIGDDRLDWARRGGRGGGGGGGEAAVSISHTDRYAVATVVWHSADVANG